MTRPIYTIGHSTRTHDELVAILRAWNVSVLVDIRRYRQSRTNPQFDEAVFGPRLGADRIAYRPMPALGGRRTRSSDVPADHNGAWENAAFKNYADYAETDEFAASLRELIVLASRSITAIMCAEAVWWRCHRRIVADHLIAHGVSVFHIFSSTRGDPALLTPFARVDRRRETVSYPPA